MFCEQKQTETKEALFGTPRMGAACLWTAVGAAFENRVCASLFSFGLCLCLSVHTAVCVCVYVNDLYVGVRLCLWWR